MGLDLYLNRNILVLIIYMKEKYSEKINLIKKTFIKDNMQEIIKYKTFFIFLEVFTIKELKDFCSIWKIRAKKEPCLIEVIMRSKYIDWINCWKVKTMWQELINKKPQLLLKEYKK